MKKFFSLMVIVILLTGVVFAQNTNTERFQKVIDRFIEAFNTGNYEKIQDDFSKEMAEELPLEKSKPIYENLLVQYGKIQKLDPPVFRDPKQATYTAHFEKGILNIVMVLNDEDKIIGLVFMQYPPDIPVPEKNNTLLSLPFRGEWFVFWGGDTREQNHHHDAQNQRFAFDFLIVDEKGKSCKNLGAQNEDFYAFGKEVLAPADGIVTDVIEGVRDNIPGSLNPYSALGNAVFIQHSDYEVSVLAHFKLGSIKVKVGDKVKTGQVIGLCGNSGNSSEPHIHYHLQNTPVIQDGTGIKCYFQKVMIIKDGKKELKANYSPVKKDTISPE